MGQGIRKRWDAVMIGAGPVGSYTSYRLSSMGYSVLLVDRKCEIGRPMHCGGLVNASLFELKGLSSIRDRTILKSVRGADVYSPSGTRLSITGKGTKAYSIDRAYFDQEVLRLSAGKGTQTLLSSRLLSIRGRRDRGSEVEIGTPRGKLHVEAELIVGCDGPASTVRRIAGLDPPVETVPGMSMEIEIHEGSILKDRVAVLTGERTAKGFFAWAIPSFGKYGLRVGLSAVSGEHLREGAERLFKDPRLADFLSLENSLEFRFSEISRVFGAIPMGQGSKTSTGNILLLGDSAGMAKPTSGGGIYPGLRAADLLADILTEPPGDIENTVRTFNQRWKRGYGRELKRSMVLRKMFRSLGDREMDIALNALSEERKVDIINSTGDIDHPMALAGRLLREDPSLMMVVPRFLPSLRRLL